MCKIFFHFFFVILFLFLFLYSMRYFFWFFETQMDGYAQNVSMLFQMKLNRIEHQEKKRKMMKSKEDERKTVKRWFFFFFSFRFWTDCKLNINILCWLCLFCIKWNTLYTHYIFVWSIKCLQQEFTVRYPWERISWKKKNK